MFGLKKNRRKSRVKEREGKKEIARERKGTEWSSSCLDSQFYGGKGKNGCLINLTWLRRGKERKGFRII